MNQATYNLNTKSGIQVSGIIGTKSMQDKLILCFVQYL